MELWIARDKDNGLFLYNDKPEKGEFCFIPIVNNLFIGSIDIDNNLFPEVTFENSPQKVEINLVKNV